jgi:hypothetical protein
MPPFFGTFGCLFETVGLAVDCDDLGVMDEAIDQGGDAGRGGVAEVAQPPGSLANVIDDLAQFLMPHAVAARTLDRGER